MPSAYPGKARCAELFPPGARHLVMLGNFDDSYRVPADQPDPPEKSQWEVVNVAIKYISIKRHEAEREGETIKLEFSAFLELYDLVNERIPKATVSSRPPPDVSTQLVRLLCFTDHPGPFSCPSLQGELLPAAALRCMYEFDAAASALKGVLDRTQVDEKLRLIALKHALNRKVCLHGGEELYGDPPTYSMQVKARDYIGEAELPDKGAKKNSMGKFTPAISWKSVLRLLTRAEVEPVRLALVVRFFKGAAPLDPVPFECETLVEELSQALGDNYPDMTIDVPPLAAATTYGGLGEAAGSNGPPKAAGSSGAKVKAKVGTKRKEKPETKEEKKKNKKKGLGTEELELLNRVRDEILDLTKEHKPLSNLCGILMEIVRKMYKPDHAVQGINGAYEKYEHHIRCRMRHLDVKGIMDGDEKTEHLFKAPIDSKGKNCSQLEQGTQDILFNAPKVLKMFQAAPAPAPAFMQPPPPQPPVAAAAAAPDPVLIQLMLLLQQQQQLQQFQQPQLQPLWQQLQQQQQPLWQQQQQQQLVLWQQQQQQRLLWQQQQHQQPPWPPHRANFEKRVAPDGVAYSFPEFQQWYGTAAMQHWEAAVTADVPAPATRPPPPPPVSAPATRARMPAPNSYNPAAAAPKRFHTPPSCDLGEQGGSGVPGTPLDDEPGNSFGTNDGVIDVDDDDDENDDDDDEDEDDDDDDDDEDDEDDEVDEDDDE